MSCAHAEAHCTRVQHMKEQVIIRQPQGQTHASEKFWTWIIITLTLFSALTSTAVETKDHSLWVAFRGNTHTQSLPPTVMTKSTFTWDFSEWLCVNSILSASHLLSKPPFCNQAAAKQQTAICCWAPASCCSSERRRGRLQLLVFPPPTNDAWSFVTSFYSTVNNKHRSLKMLLKKNNML